MILNPAEIAQGRTDIRFESAAQDKTISTSEPVLVFTDASPERFAIPLKSIMRVDCVPSSKIERIGTKDCIRQESGAAIQLIRVGHHLPVNQPAEYADDVFVIIPRLPNTYVGIVADGLVDSATLFHDTLDTKLVDSPALLGMSTLLDRLTLVIDIVGLADGHAKRSLDWLPGILPPKVASNALALN